MRLTQGIKDDAVVSRVSMHTHRVTHFANANNVTNLSQSIQPLVSTPVPITVLREEYQGNVTNVQGKIDWLEKMGWNMVWRARGDGWVFCFRQFTALFWGFMH
jgi:hypothetical protein